MNAIVPTAWTAMTATIPIYKPLVARVAAWASRCRARCAASTPSACLRTARAWLSFLASGASAGITGQAIGIGGDRLCLYTHPAEIVTEIRDGGWDAEAIAAIWQARFAPQLQPTGVRLPKVELD